MSDIIKQLRDEILKLRDVSGLSALITSVTGFDDSDPKFGILYEKCLNKYFSLTPEDTTDFFDWIRESMEDDSTDVIKINANELNNGFAATHLLIKFNELLASEIRVKNNTPIGSELHPYNNENIYYFLDPNDSTEETLVFYLPNGKFVRSLSNWCKNAAVDDGSGAERGIVSLEYMTGREIHEIIGWNMLSRINMLDKFTKFLDGSVEFDDMSNLEYIGDNEYTITDYAENYDEYESNTVEDTADFFDWIRESMEDDSTDVIKISLDELDGAASHIIREFNKILAKETRVINNTASDDELHLFNMENVYYFLDPTDVSNKTLVFYKPNNKFVRSLNDWCRINTVGNILDEIHGVVGIKYMLSEEISAMIGWNMLSRINNKRYQKIMSSSIVFYDESNLEYAGTNEYMVIS